MWRNLKCVNSTKYSQGENELTVLQSRNFRENKKQITANKKIIKAQVPWSFCNSRNYEKLNTNKMWSGLQRDSYRLLLSCVQCCKTYFRQVRISTKVSHLITSDEYSHINALIKNKLSLKNTLVDKNSLSKWLGHLSLEVNNLDALPQCSYSALHQLRTLTTVIGVSWTILPRIQALGEKQFLVKIIQISKFKNISKLGFSVMVPEFYVWRSSRKMLITKFHCLSMKHPDYQLFKLLKLA